MVAELHLYVLFPERDAREKGSIFSGVGSQPMTSIFAPSIASAWNSSVPAGAGAAVASASAPSIPSAIAMATSSATVGTSGRAFGRGEVFTSPVPESISTTAMYEPNGKVRFGGS